MKASLSEAMQDRPEQRRAFQRYVVSLTVLVQPMAEDGAGARRGGMAAAVVTDVSLSGLVFVSRRPHPPGSLVEIQISLGAHVYLIRAVIKRSQVLALPGRRAFQCAARSSAPRSSCAGTPSRATSPPRRGIFTDAPARTLPASYSDRLTCPHSSPYSSIGAAA